MFLGWKSIDTEQITDETVHSTEILCDRMSRGYQQCYYSLLKTSGKRNRRRHQSLCSASVRIIVSKLQRHSNNSRKLNSDPGPVIGKITDDRSSALLPGKTSVPPELVFTNLLHSSPIFFPTFQRCYVNVLNSVFSN